MKSSIKSRWIKNILFATIAILFIFSCVIVFSVCTRYFNSVELAMRVRNTKSVDTFFTSYNDGAEETFSLGAFDFVENFAYKDIMEVWVIDKDGKPIISSSGFSINYSGSWEDYNIALSSPDKIGVARLRLDSGEPVTAMTYILRDQNNIHYGALRYLISMEEMYDQLYFIGIIVLLVFLFVVGLITASGMYFVSSIVNPVAEIRRITSEIAKGNFSARIMYDYYDDEIGELCLSINNMAQQLSEIDKMKNDFISTVSHEIRTPLTAIKGWGDTLKNVHDNPEILQKGLEIIISETSRLSSMVEELLDYSRMQNGGIILIKEQFDVCALIEDVGSFYKQRAIEADIDIIISLPSEPVVMIGDVDKLRQVFINVLDNAIKYTHNGGKVEITVERIQKNVKIIFVDTGCGISQKDLPHIKEKFYKANNMIRGTGIGLAVADEIVSCHNGEVNIYSEVSVGTRVEIILPTEFKEDKL